MKKRFHLPLAACAALATVAAKSQHDMSAAGKKLDHASAHGGNSSNPGGKNLGCVDESVAKLHSHAGANSDARRAPAKQLDASAQVDGRRMSDAFNRGSRAS
jgi:hypothetical protein